ncbi:MAG: 7-cyano-7-deazaguanine synthase [Vicinamibacterales bacterium]|nr:7-cyano-7-deazaguanine synthase [Vicinamibacterales bacterium]
MTTDSAVLLSGGLDSAVLLAHEAERGRVHPVYVSVGLAWEAAELAMLTRLLAWRRFEGRVAPLARLEFNMRDVYAPTHWAIQGRPPAYDTPDKAVYLAGRNVVLLAKAGVFCAERQLRRVALGPLSGNPFPDATPAFFEAMSRALTLGLDTPLEVVTPFVSMHKMEVIRRGTALGVPFALTLSCMQPVDGVDAGAPRHCGRCSKCRERRDAFRAADTADPTDYAHPSPRQGRDTSGAARPFLTRPTD